MKNSVHVDEQGNKLLHLHLHLQAVDHKRVLFVTPILTPCAKESATISCDSTPVQTVPTGKPLPNEILVQTTVHGMVLPAIVKTW